MENGISNSTVGGGVTRDLYSAQLRIKQMATDSNTVTASHLLTGVYPTQSIFVSKGIGNPISIEEIRSA